MGRTIQQLRKDAGFRTAREFAEACDFTPSSLARYEKEPDNIPVKSAWKMADVLGCSIDDIVGRESELTADLRGDVQRRFDGLPQPLQESLDDYLGYLEAKAERVGDAMRQELDGGYMDIFKLYLVIFMEGMSEEEKNETLMYGASDRMRERFQQFACAKVFESAGNFMDGEEVMRGVMRAYDEFYPKAGKLGMCEW